MADKIAWASFPHEAAGTYSNNLGFTELSSYWIYVSAASFVLSMGSVGPDYTLTPHFVVTGWYYNFGTKAWTMLFDKEVDATDDEALLKFVHNRGGEVDSGTVTIRDTVASSKCALFAFRYTEKSPTKLQYKTASVSYGGVGCMTEAEYNTYVKNRPIISNGQLVSGDNCFVYYSGTSSNDERAIAIFNPENTRGTKITKNNAHHCVPKWY